MATQLSQIKRDPITGHLVMDPDRPALAANKMWKLLVEDGPEVICLFREDERVQFAQFLHEMRLQAVKDQERVLVKYLNNLILDVVMPRKESAALKEATS